MGSLTATRMDAYTLLHQGAIALAQVEANGMRVDVEYLRQATLEVAARIKNLEMLLRGCEEYRLQRRRFGQSVNLTSREQLGAVLFGDLGHPVKAYTATGKPKMDESALERIGSQYTRGFLRMEKLNKLYTTYLIGIGREVVDGFVHPNFGLHLVRSFRGQCDSPNLQNVPVRDPIQGAIIRKAFIPRDGCGIVESDYSGAEVRVACALSKDPVLTHDTVQGDMHRDMAAELFMLPVDKVPKKVRQATKGAFVFAQFYGDWYKQCTKNLLEAIDQDGLETADGVPMKKHLFDQGITGPGKCDPKADAVPGTYEHHVQKVERRFWDERFSVYNEKRKQWISEYHTLGYIDIITGFRCFGPMQKNQVMNYHIQGPSFHCLLWSLIRLQKAIKKEGLGAKITCQIHDSIVADVPVAEIPDYIALSKDIMTRQLQEAWPWVTVPMVAETDVSFTNWYDKKPYKENSDAV